MQLIFSLRYFWNCKANGCFTLQQNICAEINLFVYFFLLLINKQTNAQLRINLRTKKKFSKQKFDRNEAIYWLIMT